MVILEVLASCDPEKMISNNECSQIPEMMLRWS